MFDPNTVSVTAVISSLRDIIFIGGLSIMGWKVRSMVQPVISFFERVNAFMDHSELHMATMVKEMKTLQVNHLNHIESDLRHLSGREIVVAAVDEHEPLAEL